MFLTPLTSIVPTEIAAAALIIVGAMMMAQIRYIDFSDFRVLLPVFLTVSVMPLTYSIANGIGAGFSAGCSSTRSRARRRPSARCCGSSAPAS